MRKVEVYIQKGGKKVFDYIGKFHCWGKALEEFHGDIGEYSVGIVEDAQGKIELVYPPLMKFIEPEELEE